MSDLKPCPFCGSSDVGGASGIISCYRCPAEISVQNTNTHYAAELWNNRAARAQQPNLSRIAQKKLDQMGATVHGVLVKNGSGAWVAVSDAGRVMWLDGFEGQAARQAPASGERLYQLKSKIGGGWDDVTEDEYTHAHDSYIKRTLYTHPPAKVPEAEEVAEKVADSLFSMREGVYRIQLMTGSMYCEAGVGGFNKGAFEQWLRAQLRDLLTTPTPATTAGAE